MQPLIPLCSFDASPYRHQTVSLSSVLSRHHWNKLS